MEGIDHGTFFSTQWFAGGGGVGDDPVNEMSPEEVPSPDGWREEMSVALTDFRGLDDRGSVSFGVEQSAQGEWTEFVNPNEIGTKVVENFPHLTGGKPRAENGAGIDGVDGHVGSVRGGACVIKIGMFQ